MRSFLIAAVAALFSVAAAQAALINVAGPNSTMSMAPAIIAAPAKVLDDDVTNEGMQGFDEVQNYLLTANLGVDGGFIAAGLRISSHMIFLNSRGNALLEHGMNKDNPVVWTFDGEILGVMSSSNGSLEVASSTFLGAAGTTYPGSTFAARGMEDNPLVGFNNDYYNFSGNILNVGMKVTEPGDWIRVVTAAPVPLPAAAWMLIGGLAGLGALSRRRKRN